MEKSSIHQNSIQNNILFIKKIAAYILLCALLTPTICGCGKADSPAGNSPSKAEHQNASQGNSDSADTSSEDALSEQGLLLSATDSSAKDNSLDAYSAMINRPLRYKEVDNFLAGGISMLALGNTRASIFKAHIAPPEGDAKSWDELTYITDQGQETSLNLSENKAIPQVWGIGEVLGCDHYMLIHMDYSTGEEGQTIYRYRIAETDENLNELNSFSIDFLDAGNPSIGIQQIIKDASGYVHILVSGEAEAYYIAKSDGSIVYENNIRVSAATRLTPLYDGSVALFAESTLQLIDIASGKSKDLAKADRSWIYCTLLDQKTLLYATTWGLFTSDLSGKDETEIYRWSNHGLLPSKIATVQVSTDGIIRMIYFDSASANYLYLKPTTESVEVKEITLATSNYKKEMYLPAVVEFNKKYPSYHINLREYSYQNNASLLTELIAGKGAVLIDTSLTGFESNQEYWEPLDEVLEQMDLDGELISKAIDLGKIDGTLYGIHESFNLETVLMDRKEPTSWTYEEFLQCIEENPSWEALFNSNSSLDYGIVFVYHFFLHSMEENYLFDAQSYTTNFDSEEFRKIIRLGKTYQERHGGYQQLKDGKMLCFSATIHQPKEIALFRVLFPDGVNYVGFPAKSGSVHYISGNSPIAVRATASSEEKQIAHTFLRILLSEDSQKEAAKGVNAGFSVRKDVLESQIITESSYTDVNVTGFPYVQFMTNAEKADPEQDKKTIYEMIETAELKKSLPRELYSIIGEELDNYFYGNATEDMVIKNLENRVGLYLKEQQ